MSESPRRSPFRVAVLSLSILAVGNGCGSKATSFDAGSNPRETELSIRNANWQDVRVYMIPATGSEVVRLATVNSASSVRVAIQGRVLQEIRNRGTLRLLVRPIGTRASHRTQEVLVRPGDELLLSVANQLSLSTFFVTRRY